MPDLKPACLRGSEMSRLSSANAAEKEWTAMDEVDKLRAIVAGPLLRDESGDLWLIMCRTGVAASSSARRGRSRRGRQRRELQFCNVKTDETVSWIPTGRELPTQQELQQMAETELRELWNVSRQLSPFPHSS